ncbi:hypothetical protein ACFVUW_10460 [Streptomyces xiamenensis]|uniref:hypothetical protein n=1 Tax=Streptomyces xiamenensis TaxID=408015 RepID=UPI0036E044C7
MSATATLPWALTRLSEPVNPTGTVETAESLAKAGSQLVVDPDTQTACVLGPDGVRAVAIAVETDSPETNRIPQPGGGDLDRDEYSGPGPAPW